MTGHLSDQITKTTDLPAEHRPELRVTSGTGDGVSLLRARSVSDRDTGSLHRVPWAPERGWEPKERTSNPKPMGRDSNKERDPKRTSNDSVNSSGVSVYRTEFLQWTSLSDPPSSTTINESWTPDRRDTLVSP